MIAVRMDKIKEFTAASEVSRVSIVANCAHSKFLTILLVIATDMIHFYRREQRQRLMTVKNSSAF